jgi:hypothetical protein
MSVHDKRPASSRSPESPRRVGVKEPNRRFTKKLNVTNTETHVAFGSVRRGRTAMLLTWVGALIV